MTPSGLLADLLAGQGAIASIAIGIVGMGIVDSIQNITEEGGEQPDPATDQPSSDEPEDPEPIGDGGDLEALADDESALDVGDSDAEADGLGDVAGGGASAELENRVDTVEEELERLSSTMSTVRSENEEISDAVDDVEENVRQLLEIYEMVTRGVNPFVDEAPDGAFAGQDAASGSIGVFDDEAAEEDETAEELDGEVVDADAEAFFDDERDDPSSEDEAQTDDPPDEDGTDTETVTNTESDTSPPTDGDSKSFEELKEEYDSEESDLTADGSPGVEGAAAADANDDVTTDRSVAPTEHENADRESSPQGAQPTGRAPSGSDGSASEGAYLTGMPTGYAADLVVLEWLTDLVAEGGPAQTRTALQYYRSIGWISEAVERDLRTVVDGIAGTEAAQREGAGTIGVEDHRRSIATIDRLAEMHPQPTAGE